MKSKVAAKCQPDCGVLVQGEVDVLSREFVHRFLFPARSRGSAMPPSTEFDEVCLATFPPDSKSWQVGCPACGRAISIDPESPA